jgi:hypothetical protein
MEHIFTSIVAWNRSSAAWVDPNPTASSKRGLSDLPQPPGSRPRLSHQADAEIPWSQESGNDTRIEGRELPHAYETIFGPGAAGIPRRGYAGSHFALDDRNTCVADSLGQLFGAPRGAADLSAGTTAADASYRARELVGLAHNTTVPIALAWITALATRFGPDDPRPILLEAAVCNGPQGVAITTNGVHQIAVHASYGPWNGRVVAVATGDGHTEPLWWPANDQSPNLQPSFGISGRSPPRTPVVSTHDLSQPNTFALIHGMEAFHGMTTLGHPDPQKPCLWAGHAAGDGPWPAGAGTIPSYTKLRSALHGRGIGSGSILGDVRSWMNASSAAGSRTEANFEAMPCIIHLTGEYHAWSHWSDERTTQDGACVLASAKVSLIACGDGGCRAILICHERGHIWAEAGPDTERRMHKILRAAKVTHAASGDGAAASSRTEPQAVVQRAPSNATHQRNATGSRPHPVTGNGRIHQ